MKRTPTTRAIQPGETIRTVAGDVTGAAWAVAEAERINRANPDRRAQVERTESGELIVTALAVESLYAGPPPKSCVKLGEGNNNKKPKTQTVLERLRAL